MKKLLLSLLLAVTTLTAMAASQGWPSQYKGVLLQSFSWDSYSDTRWTKLIDQADQMCYSFDLVWIPQPGKPSGSPSMGYDPVYWISNWSSSFGNETELKNLISTFKAKNTGIIVDLVLNHKAGVSSNCDYPNETVGSYSITWPAPQTQWVVNGDNGVGTGNADTGEDFSGYCDLDHTKTQVQTNCKTYCKFMIDYMGFAGFRLDMVKGYSASYTQTYNNYANVNYCIGEYWDGSYDKVVGWINGTGKTSAAFDFPLYYGAMQRFNDGNFSGDFSNKGMCGDGANGMNRYAITFVDNHDTYQKDDHIKNNVEAANAFILALPGTPCIFMPHWKLYKSNIQKMIAARKAAGIHNQSSYTEGHAGSGYWLETTGTSCNVLALFGSITISQAGKTASQYKLVASGTNFKYYIKNTSYTNPTFPEYTPTVPEKLYLLGNMQNWDPSAGIEMTKSGSTFTWEGDCSGATYFGFTSKLASSSTAWDEILSSRYGADTNDKEVTNQTSNLTLTEATSNSFKIASGHYKFTVTFTDGVAKLTITGEKAQDSDDAVLPDFCTYVEGKQFAYFEKPSGWGNTIRVWAWSGTSNNLYSAWPGQTITYVGTTPTTSSVAADGIDRASVGSGLRVYQWINNTTKQAENIIFNDGSKQTGDMTFVNGGYYTETSRIGLVTDGTTGINDLTTETAEDHNAPFYTIDGRKVNGQFTRGIYVRNGKKYVIR